MQECDALITKARATLRKRRQLQVEKTTDDANPLLHKTAAGILAPGGFRESAAPRVTTPSKRWVSLRTSYQEGVAVAPQTLAICQVRNPGYATFTGHGHDMMNPTCAIAS